MEYVQNKHVIIYHLRKNVNLQGVYGKVDNVKHLLHHKIHVHNYHHKIVINIMDVHMIMKHINVISLALVKN